MFDKKQMCSNDWWCRHIASFFQSFHCWPNRASASCSFEINSGGISSRALLTSSHKELLRSLAEKF